MKILLTGATGFIGARLREGLLAQGHALVCPARRPGPPHPRCQWIVADLATAEPPFVEWLSGVHVAINAVGIFREHAGASFAVLHTQMPMALFQACVRRGVKRVVQLSALGADARAQEDFLRSKYAAEAELLNLPRHATVLMPSLVFGPDGASSRQLLTLASMPLVCLPAGGLQLVQPVHVDDVVAAVCALLRGPAAAPGQARSRRLPLVGPGALPLRDYLLILRQGLGLGRARTLAVPQPLMAIAARIGEHLPGALLNRSAWRMLQRGSTASAEPLSSLLRRPARAPRHFIAPGLAECLRLRSQLSWLLPLLRLTLAAVWIATAVVSAGVYPVDESLALLQRAGVPQGLQLLALYGAAGLDLAFGIATLWPPRRHPWRRGLWGAQAALILGYSIVITLRLPEFWLHPYGPMTKNLPLLALLLLLGSLDRPGLAEGAWRDRAETGTR